MVEDKPNKKLTKEEKPEKRQEIIPKKDGITAKTVFKLIFLNLIIIAILGGLSYLIITSPFDLRLLIIPLLILMLPIWFIENYSLVYEPTRKQRTIHRIIILIAVVISVVLFIILTVDIVKTEADQAMNYIDNCEPPENYLQNFREQKSVSSFNTIITWCCENYETSYKLCEKKTSKRK